MIYVGVPTKLKGSQNLGILVFEKQIVKSVHG